MHGGFRWRHQGIVPCIFNRVAKRLQYFHFQIGISKMKRPYRIMPYPRCCSDFLPDGLGQHCPFVHFTISLTNGPDHTKISDRGSYCKGAAINHQHFFTSHSQCPGGCQSNDSRSNYNCIKSHKNHTSLFLYW